MMAGKKNEDLKDVLTTIDKEGVKVNLTLLKKVKGKGTGSTYLLLTEDGAQYVTKLASFGCTIEEIAGEIGVSVPTLTNARNKTLFYEAFQKGSFQFKTSIRVSQSRIMKKGSAPMAIFLGKNYLGQKDTITQDIPATALSEFAKAMSEYKDDGN